MAVSVFIPYIVPRPYQFCTGQCTGNLSDCFCVILQSFYSVFMWPAVLVGSAYYYKKAQPTFFAFLAVIVILFIVYLVSFILLTLLVILMLPPT